MRTSVMKISDAALLNNAAAIRAQVPAKVKLMCVVKANAYGHGSVAAARLMLHAGADAFAVAIVEEAAELRNAGIAAPILILGGAGVESLREAVALDVSQAVYSVEALNVLQAEAARLGRRAKAHLKIDTGMSRIGVLGEKELVQLLNHWKRCCPDVEMEGIFTHFCVAECDPEFTQRQNARFAQALAIVRSMGFNPIAHAAATSAMLRSEYQYDMVRAGIGLYGTLVPELDGKLQYAQTLCAKPIRMEIIHQGDTVGYGRTFTARRDSRIITVPIGYGDGYPRILSNRADVLVCGKRAPIVGNVCMDMLMADVTDIPEADIDSEVVLMGAQGDERITPDELAQLAGTIPYEIMLGFSPRVRTVREGISGRD
ncbi:MAG: alanine racemase [Clostridia bacterium]|nr:alanine racemase [Clostridia bacterium]